jgi:hypothetical protein
VHQEQLLLPLRLCSFYAGISAKHLEKSRKSLQVLFLNIFFSFFPFLPSHPLAGGELIYLNEYINSQVASVLQLEKEIDIWKSAEKRLNSSIKKKKKRKKNTWFQFDIFKMFQKRGM